MLPDLALGATIAAVIGALATLLGLIITKEQKTSEFRQAWVDALRDDLTDYVTQVNVIADAASITYANNEKKLAAMSKAYAEFNKANFRINLRLNRDEDLSLAVLSSLSNFNALIASGDGLTPDNIREEEVKFLQASQDLLKYEWNRVKKGELAFRIAKRVAVAILIAGPVLITYGLIVRPYVNPGPSAQPALIEHSPAQSRSKPNQETTPPANKTSLVTT